jgi:AbrB family looped-hinge helix DNA binding protein
MQGGPVKHLLASVTERGQVTIPSEVRRLLGITPPQKVAFEIDGNDIRLVPAGPSLKEVFGAVQPASRRVDFARLGEEAWEEKAKRTVDGLNKP